MSFSKVKPFWRDWELRYEHDRDMQAAMCEANGVPVPKEKEYGTLTLVKGIWNKFNGPKFWPAFTAKGHTACVFVACKCREKQGRVKK